MNLTPIGPPVGQADDSPRDQRPRQQGTNMNIHRLRKIVRNLPSVLHGYNIYVDTDKLRLIDRVFREAQPTARSFADLGGVWNVNGAYTLYGLRHHSVDRGVLVDTDFPDRLPQKLEAVPRLQIIRGDFADAAVIERVGTVDVVFLFDVLLHQANPSWDTVLSAYAQRARCMAIYNQQYVLGNASIRLTSLPLEEYVEIAPRGRTDVYRYVYEHADEIHPTYGKPWRDIHNIFQWGITDEGLRAVMAGLGFREYYYRNLGRFSNLPAFENHAFIFVR